MKTMIKNITSFFEKDLSFNLILFLIICVGIYYRISIYLYNQSFWGDEIFLGMNMIDKTFSEFFAPLSGLQVAPPIFLIISKFLFEIARKTGSIDYTDLALRFIPMISSVLTLPLFAYLTKKLFNNRYITLTATALLAFNPLSISFSQEFKQYTLEMFISLIILYIFINTDFKKNSALNLFLKSVLLSLLLWCSITAPIIITCGFIYLIYKSLKEEYFNYKKFFSFFIPLEIFFSAYYIYFCCPCINTNYDDMYIFWSKYNGGTFLSENFFQTFGEGINFLCPLFSNPRAYFPFILSGGLIMLLNKNIKEAILIFLPFIITVFASCLEMYPFQGRLLLFLLPFIILIFCQFLTLLRPAKITSITLIILILCATFSTLKKHPYDFIINHNSTRTFFKTVMAENPDFSRNLNIYQSQFYYYLLVLNKKTSKEKGNIIDFSPYNETKIKKALNKLENNNDYYFAYTVSVETERETDDALRFLNFLEKSKSAKIIYIKKDPFLETLFLVKFNKLSDF